MRSFSFYFVYLFVIVVCLFVFMNFKSDHIPLWLSSPFIRPYCSLITANGKKERKSVPNCTPKTKNKYKLERKKHSSSISTQGNQQF